jgi:hypothetical protein
MQRLGGLRRLEKGLQCVALAGLDTLRKRDLFLVSEHPPAAVARRHGRPGRTGRGGGVIGSSGLPEPVELEGFTMSAMDVFSPGCESGAGCVHWGSGVRCQAGR